MRKSRFTEEQIIGMLKEGEAGGNVSELCRRHGVSKESYYRWKAKYGGMDVDFALLVKMYGNDDPHSGKKRAVCIGSQTQKKNSHKWLNIKE